MQKLIYPASRSQFWMTSLALTCCLVTVSNDGVSLATPLNSINYDQVIKGGTYENTANGKTVFYNSNGLWLQSGTGIHGIEVNNHRQQTGNGGNFMLQAPNSVVRLDGDINVNGFTVPGNTGHGGNVTIDAAYLYQSGNIFARGGSGGGIVNINVNSATFANTAGIDASAPCGAGGVINIKATGVADLQRNGDLQVSHMNTSGANPAINTNLIDIHSGLIHNFGILRADGVSGGAGGTIRLTASGGINLQPVADALYSTHVFTPDEAKARFDDVHHLATNVAPLNYIENSGEISADGGNNLASQGVGGKGGSIQFNSVAFINGGSVSFTGRTHANGGAGYAQGGDGGNISAHVGGFSNASDAIMSANGGNGTTRIGAFGGSGGVVQIYSQSTFNTGKRSLMSANGGNGTAQQGNGGKGGVLCLRGAAQNALINVNMGRMEAIGGNGGGGNLSTGGDGGTIEAINIRNFNMGTMNTSAGHP